MWSSSPAIEITPEERAELERIVGSGKTEQRIAQRARIILGAAAGKSNNALAKELETSRPTVLDWRQRFAKGGVKALYEDRPRGRSFTPLVRAKEAEVVAMTQTAPAQATHWSCRRMAEICSISKASVQRIWRANGLKPHLVRTFKLSNDPDFIEKLEDVVGLYMNPPDHALVFCIDEKSQIQALDRTQPGLPMKKGRAGTMTHDYKRNGTTTLFAALDVLKGEVIGRCMPQHRHQEFLKFLKAMDRSTPKHLDIHCIATIIQRTNIPGSKPGLPGTRTFICILFRHLHLGLISSSVGSARSRRSAYGVAYSKVSTNSNRPSWITSNTTTPIPNLLPGRNPPTTSSSKSIAAELPCTCLP